MKYLLSWVEIEDANENTINTSWKYKLVNTRSISVKDRNKNILETNTKWNHKVSHEWKVLANS